MDFEQEALDEIEPHFWLVFFERTLRVNVDNMDCAANGCHRRALDRLLYCRSCMKNMARLGIESYFYVTRGAQTQFEPAIQEAYDNGLKVVIGSFVQAVTEVRTRQQSTDLLKLLNRLLLARFDMKVGKTGGVTRDYSVLKRRLVQQQRDPIPSPEVSWDPSIHDE
jgi:hypothetical protein